MKHVEVIGGGNGAALSLSALKEHADWFQISAVISTSDSGGSSGRLREEFGSLPSGDLLRAVLALSRYEYDLLKKIFYTTRFSGAGKLDDHNIGNIFLTLGTAYCGDPVASLRALEQAVGAVGHVYPATLKPGTLVVELQNGEHVRGEHEIDAPTYDRSLRITRAWLESGESAFEDGLGVIREADAIILGPGSLYTSVVAALLPQGMGDAIAASAGKVIAVVGDTYRARGETGPTTLSEHVRELQAYVPKKIDCVIYDARAEGAEGCMTMDSEQLKEYHLVHASLERGTGDYAPDRLGSIFREFIS